VWRVLHSRPVGSETDLTVDDVLAADAWARASAAEHVKDLSR
jgi:hypothetical protein